MNLLTSQGSVGSSQRAPKRMTVKSQSSRWALEALPFHAPEPIFISVWNHFGVDKAQGWVGLLSYSSAGSSLGPGLFSSPAHLPHSLFSLPVFSHSLLSSEAEADSDLNYALVARSCLEPITIQNGFSQTEKNSCLHYLNASPFPAPLIGSLITGRGARWLIRKRLLVK